MQEIKKDGSMELTNFEDFFKEDEAVQETWFMRLQKSENKAVALHKPGSVITDKRGQRYEVQKNGAWKKLDTQEG